MASWHILPRLFTETSSPKERPKPRLERTHAEKNINYEATPCSTSIDSTLEARAIAFRAGKTSFRIDGREMQWDVVCEMLGFSGPEDLGISATAWEASKVWTQPGSGFHDNDLCAIDCHHVTDGYRIGKIPEVEEHEEDDRAVNNSTQDSLSSFAQEIDSEATRSIHRGFCFDGGGTENAEGGFHLSISCCDAISDEDSSSSLATPMSNVSPNARFRRKIALWEKGELLGRGSFGSVYEGISEDGFFFAVKEVSLLDQRSEGLQSIYQLEQEIQLLSQFEHDNIVRYYGSDKDDSVLYIFIELVTKGSLLNLYKKYHLRDSQVSAYTRQILHGLKYLHDRGVVHRDIKCANILVDADGFVKLADFGLAKVTQLNDVKSCKGTAFWMAPEVINPKYKGYGLPADIWSLGCTVLEMLSRRMPYFPMESMAAIFMIGRGIPPRIPNYLSNDARDFILQCLQANAKDRPTATQLLDHPFITAHSS